MYLLPRQTVWPRELDRWLHSGLHGSKALKGIYSCILRHSPRHFRKAKLRWLPKNAEFAEAKLIKVRSSCAWPVWRRKPLLEDDVLGQIFWYCNLQSNSGVGSHTGKHICCVTCGNLGFALHMSSFKILELLDLLTWPRSLPLFSSIARYLPVLIFFILTMPTWTDWSSNQTKSHK